MNLSQALSYIENNLHKKAFRETKHFKTQSEKRGLEINFIFERKEVVGIAQQDQNLYKVWFAYTQSKDLIVIVRISVNEILQLITLFPCDINLRIRKNAKS